MASYLGATVFVKHVARMLNEYATLADHLSRSATVEWTDRELLRNARKTTCESCIYDWLLCPKLSFNFPKKLLSELKEKV
jgi:hypothetical protein